ncbi:hypothetical protein IAU60_004177 [Kwoniella sp. DSM 27419]
MADESPAATLKSLTASLAGLEAALDPLCAEEWSQTVDGLSTLERAKMDILASYTINDLIWVYLKLKGVDPAKHDVTAELDRIKLYYGKVKAVEEPESARPSIDSAAAKRFITSSLPKSQHLPKTSAAELAAKQARAAVAEQEEDASLRRAGKQGRFRFIQDQGSEKLVPGQAEETDGADADGDEDAVMAELDEAAAQDETEAQDEAEAFLCDVQQEIDN